MLQDLNRLVLLNMISTAQAAVVGRNLKTMLDALRQRADGPRGSGLPQDAVTALWRDNPQVLSLLESFLSDSDEQIDWLAGQAREADGDVDEQA